MSVSNIWFISSVSATTANEKQKRSEDIRPRTDPLPPSSTAPAGPSNSVPSRPTTATPAADANYPQEMRDHWAQNAATKKAKKAADAAERRREKRQNSPEEVERLQRARVAAEIREGRRRLEMQRVQYEKNRRSVGKRIVDGVKEGYGEAKRLWRKRG